MKQFIFFIACFVCLYSCSDDDGLSPNPFVVAFDMPSGNLTESRTIQLNFSEKAQSAGFIKIAITHQNSSQAQTEYGIDYNTYPEPENGFIILPFSAGDVMASFEFNSLIGSPSLEDQDKGVEFSIAEIDYRGDVSIQGYANHIISFRERVGGMESPAIGGPNEPYQVYFDLSTGNYKSVKRDSWDFGFYSGNQFRVILNGSIYMAAIGLESNEIDEITQANIPDNYFADVSIGTFDPENVNYIDNPTGDISDTAIDEISLEPSENQVYLVNMGFEVGTTAPNTGGVAVAGERRGWKKIRILRQENGYLLQYADLDSTTHEEVFIPKSPEFNYTHYSLENGIIEVQPPKDSWDLCFTVFTNIVTDNNGQSAGSYGFADFVFNNILAGAKAFMVNTNDGVSYKDYTLDVEQATALLSEDQRAIGSNWRNVFEGVYDDRFFVINDTNGNWYKIRFLAFKNENGERGHPMFEYQLL